MHEPLFCRLAKGGFNARLQRCIVSRITELGQHIPGVRRPQRIARSRDMFEDEIKAGAGNQFKGCYAVAAVRAQQSQQGHRGIRIGDHGKGDSLRAWSRKQFEHGGADDAQRAFGADK